MLSTPLIGDAGKCLAEHCARLERENARLRGLLECRERQIAALRPGLYILTEDGDFNGGPGITLHDMRNALPDYIAEGVTAVVVEVHEVQSFEADDHPDCCENYGVRPGVDFPATLYPAT